ncbi:MAG TPA: hypothetical protein VHO03_14115 [Ignavibacteriales bacterium]|nr:hypothetical protein [Ignavibacteriales bacterium]
MLPEIEPRLKKSAYEDIRTPLIQLMPPGVSASAEYLINKIAASAEDLQETKNYYSALMDLSEKYSLHYKTEKTWERRDSLKTTHQMITEQALCIINMNNFPKADDLIGESSGPDNDPENVKFVMEGHFCGRLSNGGLGNFLEKYMPHLIFDLLENFGELGKHLNETALTNFETYSEKFLDDRPKVKYLAWALHFLQDITAPHHAANIPAIIPSFLIDVNQGRDTHSPFEGFANELMIKRPNQFNVEAERILNILRGFPMNAGDSKEIKKFGKMILQKSFAVIRSPIKDPVIKNVKGALQAADHDAWKEVISMAMPLAIASTAALLEKVLKVNP